MQRWLWVTLPDVYTAHPFRVDDTFVWSCHVDSRPGDIALLYRADLFKDFSHVFRVDSDPYEEPGIAAKYNGALACDCTLRAALQRPITLDQIRQDRVLSTWPAAQVGSMARRSRSNRRNGAHSLRSRLLLTVRESALSAADS